MNIPFKNPGSLMVKFPGPVRSISKGTKGSLRRDPPWLWEWESVAMAIGGCGCGVTVFLCCFLVKVNATGYSEIFWDMDFWMDLDGYGWNMDGYGLGYGYGWIKSDAISDVKYTWWIWVLLDVLPFRWYQRFWPIAVSLYICSILIYLFSWFSK